MIRASTIPSARRRVTSVLALGAFLCASYPWGSLSRSDVSAESDHERYPCESHGCGCGSARHCWTACCCHSTREKLAWAIEHGVTPPADIAFSDAEWRDAAESVAPSSGCHKCGAKNEVAQAATSPNRPGKPREGGRVMSPMGCKGLSAQGVTAELNATPQAAPIPSDEPVRHSILICQQIQPDSRTLEVSSPPPEFTSIRHS